MAKLYEYELGKSADMMIRVIGRVVDIKGGGLGDGICLNSPIWMDDEKIMDNGIVIHPELKKLVEKLRK
jgi:hypothetical protein